MIETIMVFAIGFLTAALLALLILPGLSRRAERLARRRVEARLPTSVSQIAAERDLLRAELAVQARRVELKAEGLAKDHAANMLELGRRDVEIASVQAELATRSQVLAALEAEHAKLTTEHNGTVATLAETAVALSQTRHELGEREAALVSLSANHRALSEISEQRRLSIAGLETTAEGLRIRIGDLERDVAGKTGELTAAGTALAERNTQIAVQEHKIAALTHEKEERDKFIEQLRTDLAASVASAVAAERSSGDLEIKLTAALARAELAEGELEATRKQLQEVEGALATTVESLRAEKAAAAGSLEEVRAERRTLEHELVQLRRSLQLKAAEAQAENEELRRAMEGVAAQIMASVGGPEGSDSVGNPPRPERRKVRLAAVERRRSESAPDDTRENTTRNQGSMPAESGLEAESRPVLEPASASQG